MTERAQKSTGDPEQMSQTTEESDGERKGFIGRLSDGGIPRIVYARDWPSAVVITTIAVFIHFTAFSVVSSKLVEVGTSMAITLIAFILAGLAIFMSFTDDEFLALMKELGVYENFLFSFEYNVYLTIIVSVAGIIYQSYQLPSLTFFVFLFLFMYMIFSVAELVSVIVSIGTRKAEVAKIKQS